MIGLAMPLVGTAIAVVAVILVLALMFAPRIAERFLPDESDPGPNEPDGDVRDRPGGDARPYPRSGGG